MRNTTQAKYIKYTEVTEGNILCLIQKLLKRKTKAFKSRQDTADEQTRFVLIHQFNPQKQAFDR